MAPFRRNPPQGLGVVTQGSPVEEGPYSAGGWILRPAPFFTPHDVCRASLGPLPFGGSSRREGSHCRQYAAYMSGLRPPTRPPPPIPKERRRARHNCRTEAPRESPLPTDPTPRQGVRASRSQGSPGEPCCPGAPLRTSLVHLRASPAQDWGLKSPRCPFSPLLAGHHFGPNFKQNKTKC